MTKIVGCVILDHCIIEDGYDPLGAILRYPLLISEFLERSSRVACLEGARKLAPRPNYRSALRKRVSRPMPEVNFPHSPPLRKDPLTMDHADLSAGSYRNAKLEISDWTAAGVYDYEESDEDEGPEEDPEDL